MKKLLLFAILTILCIGCSQGDQPLTEDEASAFAPEAKIETTRLRLVSSKFRLYAQFREEYQFLSQSKDLQMVTSVGTPTEVYLVLQGSLTKQDQIFEKEMYHLLWCFLGDQIVLVNILDNQIRYISADEDDEHFYKFDGEERLRLWGELADKWFPDKKELTPDEQGEIDTLVYSALSKLPFFPHETLASSGDVIEVVIKHRFTFTLDYGIRRTKEIEMLFVDVKRNITRPHITFPQPLLP